MQFDWTEFLHLAKAMFNRSRYDGEEALFRSAISRAYYSAYGYLTCYAIKKWNFLPSTEKKVDDHWRLRQTFIEHDQGDIADKLNELRRFRNDCDYHHECIKDSKLKYQATVAILTAEKIREQLK